MFNLYYYFSPYRNSDRFSDFNTRIAHRAGVVVRSLPPDVTPYWYGERSIFFSHPTFRWEAQGRQVYDVFRDGRIAPRIPPPHGPAAFLALPHQKPAWEAIQRLCPGGIADELRDSKDRLLFYFYSAPAESDCGQYASDVGARSPD
ncbi:hypothetical protein BH23ACI1_BH23ACI1_08780 [soil metagenome]